MGVPPEQFKDREKLPLLSSTVLATSDISLLKKIKEKYSR